MKTLLFISFLTTFYVFAQRDPRPKDQANVFWNGAYSLYSLSSDEEIKPNSSGKYEFWGTTNENPQPIQYSLMKGNTLYVYKFISYSECLNSCNEIRKSKGLALLQTNQVSVEQISNTKPTTNLKSVVIGTQTWTTENLNVSTFRNGDPIPEAKTNEEWITADNNKQPAWCYPEEGVRFGKLYNYYAVNDPRGLAPFGWHIPTIAEWGVMGKKISDVGEIETYGVLSKTAGKKIKSISEWSNWQEYVDCDKCSYWTDAQRNNNHCDKCRNTKRMKGRILSGNGSNSSKLSCYPVSGRLPANGLGKFSDMKKGVITHYWSISKEISSDEVYCVFLLNSSDLLYNDPLPQGIGLPIRCIKD